MTTKVATIVCHDVEDDYYCVGTGEDCMFLLCAPCHAAWKINLRKHGSLLEAAHAGDANKVLPRSGRRAKEYKCPHGIPPVLTIHSVDCTTHHLCAICVSPSLVEARDSMLRNEL